jgi:NADPH-dependent 2,4-dienoyl-CoA reductase/sulfur reductase-like enzyme
MTAPTKVVVVGAGLAGLRVVEELRSGGYDGSLTLIGAEARPPYDRPPLSKKVLTGELDDTGLRADFDSLAVDLRLAETATGLAGQVVHTDRAEYPADAVVLATGASPVTLPGGGPQRVLRTADDALGLRADLQSGTRLVIIGAGWIGAELATAAAGRGCDVTVVEAASAPLAGAIGPEVGQMTVPWYAEAGVRLRVGQQVAGVKPGGVALADGGWLPADLVVTAVGVRPSVAWLSGSGIGLENGVAVDAHLRASVPGVYAAGDCAAFWSGRFGRRLRFEHWDVALHAPEVVAANLRGAEIRYDPVPYFWSEQFGRMIQYVGWHGDADREIWRGDPAEPKWSVCWLAGDRLVATLAVGLPREMIQSRRVIEAGGLVDPGKLADAGTAIRDCAIAG